MPGYSILLGMHAFGLEETGDYAPRRGRRAAGRSTLQPLDCWAHHAVAHVMEMQGRAEDGIGWMIAREPHWSGDDNFFKVHNWWHRALYHLDLGQVRRRCSSSTTGRSAQGRSIVALDMVDASALLWRLHLSGHDVGDRWNELAADLGRARRRPALSVQRLARRRWPISAPAATPTSSGCWTAYRRRRAAASDAAALGRATSPCRWSKASRRSGAATTRPRPSRLHGARYIANSFGGSHAQRDIIDWTLTEAAIRGGLTDLAEALANERLALKPHSPVNRSFLNRAQAVLPDRQAA